MAASSRALQNRAPHALLLVLTFTLTWTSVTKAQGPEPTRFVHAAATAFLPGSADARAQDTPSQMSALRRSADDYRREGAIIGGIAGALLGGFGGAVACGAGDTGDCDLAAVGVAVVGGALGALTGLLVGGAVSKGP